LVTGGAGFIGSHTVDELVRRGHSVRVLDNLEPQVHGAGTTRPSYLHPDAELIVGDICDPDALDRALKDVSVVIHDAALVGVGQSQYQPARYTRVNTLGTAMLFEAIVERNKHIERVLVASSMSIYGEGMYRRPSDGALLTPSWRSDEQLKRHDFEMRDATTGEVLEPVPTPESKPLVCTSIYALNKRDQEEYALVMGQAHKLPVVACRYFNVFGTRQALSNPYTGVAAIFSSRLLNGNRPLVYEDGKQSRDFIPVRDLVAAKLFLMDEPRAVGEVFNIATGRPTSIAEMAKLLAERLGRADLTAQITGQSRSGDIRHCFGDASKLRVLGWKPTIGLEAGLDELVAWTKKQHAEDNVLQAHGELASRGLIQS